MLTGMSWVLTMLTAAVGSSSFHYRNLLISVVKDSVMDRASATSAVGLATQSINSITTGSGTGSLSSSVRSFLRRILLGPKAVQSTDTSGLGFVLGKQIAEVLFAVFFMEILQVLLRDLTDKCKNMGIAVRRCWL